MAGFLLPLQGTKAREALGDIATVAEILDRANLHKMKDFGETLRLVRRQIEESKGLIRSINVICLRADDERWMISVGPKGGWKKIWNFGKGR